MKVTLVVVGKVRGELAEAVAEYESRATRYWKLEVIEVDAGAPRGKGDPESVMAAEADRILGRLPAAAEVAILTRDGRPLSSRGLAGWLQDHAVLGSAGVALVIGGAYGIHGTVRARARRRISLSAMTFPHEMARLILAEQLYRAGTILRGEPYHKGP
ncbi:MAG: 23S rRNA (pseudouridine(1915)-N(3))-methyltransferase RlmH [Gemmatimonadales bacterium]|nr:MAG: 23S rRNA (pseudouridine(1915)-N(3))-methyltransferase RlmH [Gemmatimonadales bacterium]